MMRGNYSSGGDAKAIAAIAKSHFFNFTAMFEHYGWPERKAEMLPKVHAHVAETYGSVKAIENHFVRESKND